MKADIVWIREGLPRASEIGPDTFDKCWGILYTYFRRNPKGFRLEYPGRVSHCPLTKP